MATVNVRENQNIEGAVKKFRSEVEKEGILTTLKSKRHFMKPSRVKYEHRKKLEYKLSKRARNEEDKMGKRARKRKKDEDKGRRKN